ncbi:MAG: beta-ketoacyl-ACP reductase [Candidatus Omnitrophica bacterium CG07_land_8_20_14_0_80_50_8]|nr:MAG: beta-ketoacyl-ACP reductase [Candidatus Omnitrophica bacterium CG07_land_8_20_14_0_80_50_8]
MRFKSKVVLVTGGSRGIGTALVRRFVEEGARVYFTYLSSKAQAAEVVRLTGKPHQIFALACDVRKKKDVQKIVDEILEKESSLDILINNAGIIRDGLFLTMSDEDWSDVMETNLGGVYHFCKAVSKQMVTQGGGKIINISSVIAELGSCGQVNYAASKGAINAFTRSLAAELASKKVTVNALAPGMVNTRMSSAARAAFGDKIKDRIPLGDFAEPEEIASVVAFLASEDARYITGQIIAVDGGLSLLCRR